MPSHSHALANINNNGGSLWIYVQNSGSSYALRYLSSQETSSKGNNQPHNNLQPYVVTYMWKRIS